VGYTTLYHFVSPFIAWRKLPAALIADLAKVDPNSEDSQEIGSIILRLDEFCGD